METTCIFCDPTPSIDNQNEKKKKKKYHINGNSYYVCVLSSIRLIGIYFTWDPFEKEHIRKLNNDIISHLVRYKDSVMSKDWKEKKRKKYSTINDVVYLHQFNRKKSIFLSVFSSLTSPDGKRKFSQHKKANSFEIQWIKPNPSPLSRFSIVFTIWTQNIVCYFIYDNAL